MVIKIPELQALESFQGRPQVRKLTCPDPWGQNFLYSGYASLYLNLNTLLKKEGKKEGKEEIETVY